MASPMVGTSSTCWPKRIKTGVVVLEYASEGRVVSTGARYTNRYISALTITDRKVTHWRDYLDPVAVFDARMAVTLTSEAPRHPGAATSSSGRVSSAMVESLDSSEPLRREGL
jgi:hypothetical protein